MPKGMSKGSRDKVILAFDPESLAWATDFTQVTREAHRSGYVLATDSLARVGNGSRALHVPGAARLASRGEEADWSILRPNAGLISEKFDRIRNVAAALNVSEP